MTDDEAVEQAAAATMLVQTYTEVRTLDDNRVKMFVFREWDVGRYYASFIMNRMKDAQGDLAKTDLLNLAIFAHVWDTIPDDTSFVAVEHSMSASFLAGTIWTRASMTVDQPPVPE